MIEIVVFNIKELSNKHKIIGYNYIRILIINLLLIKWS